MEKLICTPAEFIEIIENEEVSKTYMLPLFKSYEEKLNLFNRFIELTNNLKNIYRETPDK